MWSHVAVNFFSPEYNGGQDVKVSCFFEIEKVFFASCQWQLSKSHLTSRTWHPWNACLKLKQNWLFVQFYKLEQFRKLQKCFFQILWKIGYLGHLSIPHLKSFFVVNNNEILTWKIWISCIDFFIHFTLKKTTKFFFLIKFWAVQKITIFLFSNQEPELRIWTEILPRFWCSR